MGPETLNGMEGMKEMEGMDEFAMPAIPEAELKTAMEKIDEVFSQ